MVPGESQHPLIKPISVTAAILGIVQGLVWIILTLLAALIYLEAWQPEALDPLLIPKTYGGILSWVIGNLYLNSANDDVIEDDVFVSGRVLFGWVVVYFVLSIIWVAISVIQLSAILQQQKGKTLRSILLAWAVSTLIICICDLVLAGLLAADYNTIVQDINEVWAGPLPPIFNAYLGYLPLACGVLMTLVARGFVLWVVNVIFVVVIITLGLKSSEFTQNRPHRNNLNNHSDTFGQVATPNKGFNNPGYNWKDERPNFNRNDSNTTPWNPREGVESMPKLPPISSTNERLAKIGRQGANNPPQNIPPPRVPQSTYVYPTSPRVPSPDYSPPPQLKSALKSRPQNAFGFSNNRY